MMSAYVKSLQRTLAVEAAREEGAGKPAHGLKQRFVDWFATVPEISRLRPYSMSELEQVLNTQGRFLSPVLLALGWERRRKWSRTGQNARYWVPPS